MQDAYLVGLKRGLEGFIVTTELCGIMPGTALVFADHACGLRVEPDDAAALTNVVLRIGRVDREGMGRRAGCARFELPRDRPLASSAYKDLLVEAVWESRAA